MMDKEVVCPVCGGQATPLDVVDFSKSCEEARGKFLPLSGIPIYYFLCSFCNYCFAPEFGRWEQDDFEEKIYNDDYVLVDPDYSDARPRCNAQALIDLFGEHRQRIRHLDYGGGQGLLSELLREKEWKSTSYDPFVDKNMDIMGLGRFDLVTAFEVFEHVPDVNDLMNGLNMLLANEGLLMFSTLVSDNNIKPNQRVNWWYASPRNGHISLFSKRSLKVLATRNGYKFGSFSDGLHAFWKQVPPWAGHLIRVSP